MIRVDTVEEMFDLAMAFSHQPVPRGNRVAIVTNAGGPGIIIADACEAHGLAVTELAPETTALLRAHFPEEASLANPVDMIASATPQSYRVAVEAVLGSGEVQDVTAHAKTRFEPLTLWSVSVDGSGRVTAKAAPGFERARVDGELVRMGTVGVFHGDPRERRRGFALVEFEILP